MYASLTNRSTASTPQFSPDKPPFDSPQIITDGPIGILGPNSVSTSSSMSYSVRTVNSYKSRMNYVFSRKKFKLGTSNLVSPPLTASLVPEGNVSAPAARQLSLPLAAAAPVTPSGSMQLPGDGEVRSVSNSNFTPGLIV